MSNLRDIRSRLNSVKSTRQITAAMKMVSAAKLKKAQDKINLRIPYVKTLEDIIANIAEHLHEIDNNDNVYAEQRDVKNVLIVLIASNRGLCGAFNNNICKKAVNFAREKYPEAADNNNIKFYCFGKKAIDFIAKTKYEVYDCDTLIFDDLNFERVAQVAARLMHAFKNKEFDKIEIVYNKFMGTARSTLADETYLPYSIKPVYKDFPSEYIFEPDLKYIKESVIPDYLKSVLYSIFISHLASEHSARMTAMHQATDNASELIKELTLEYNKARQAAITKEILEITSGAEALKGT